MPFVTGVHLDLNLVLFFVFLLFFFQILIYQFCGLKQFSFTRITFSHKNIILVLTWWILWGILQYAEFVRSSLCKWNKRSKILKVIDLIHHAEKNFLSSLMIICCVVFATWWWTLPYSKIIGQFSCIERLCFPFAMQYSNKLNYIY